ncbi:COG3650 family protein [Caulobacter sp. UC70_42]|uniref:COG3650 family protein n=1 Tax=Caulobacter sp. UC70_42 TaxID=3374551 RepID=UPI0037567FF3
MRTAVLIAAALVLAACDAPLGSNENAPPPADAPVMMGPDYGGDFDAVGTEPFWTLKIRAASMTLARPDHAEVATANPGVRADGDQGVWDGTVGEQRLVLRLTPGDCSDGMSDRHYGYSAEVWIDGETLRGCASKTQDLAAQPRP